MIADRLDPDVVGICLPYYRNSEASIAAARRGVHVVSEKPVATSLEDLATLKKAVTDAGILGIPGIGPNPDY